MESQPTVLLRAGPGIDAHDTVRALGAAGFRVLLVEPAEELASGDVSLDLIIRHFSEKCGGLDGSGAIGEPPSVPVLSVDLTCLDSGTVADVAGRVIGWTPIGRRWTGRAPILPQTIAARGAPPA